MRCLSIVLLLIPTIAVADEPLRVPITRDTWFSNVGEEADGNNGGAAQIKIKSHQEMALLDFDPSKLKGRTIQAATLHLHRSGSADLLRVTVGSFGAEWVEGTGASYEKQVGSSTFRHQKHPSVPWSYPGSDLCSVILNQGGTRWASADATPPDRDGWQTVAVDPKVIAARVAGVSEGLFLYDDTGSEWKREGEKWTPLHMPNRYAHSKDSNKRFAPYLTVTLGPEDAQAPSAPSGFSSQVADLPAGEALVRWSTPGDVGPSGLAGFVVTCNGRAVPRYLIPAAAKTGESVLMHVRDLGLAAGSVADISVRAVDGAGNVGPAAKTSARVSSVVAQPLPPAVVRSQPKAAPLPELAGSAVAIIDELDKVDPTTGRMIPTHPVEYLANNPLWDAGTRTIRLHAARNEFVSFQVLLQGVLDVEPSLSFDDRDISVAFGRYTNVETKSGPLPDPILPLNAARSRSDARVKSSSLHGEVFVGHGTKAGEHRGELRLRAAGQQLVLAVVLTVWDFTLPNVLSFIPEMNCYGLPSNERDYYRMAHRHRTYLNRVPYSQRGEVAEGCAPVWNGKSLDWTAWDRRFGPYFDGSAFADLPRKGVPIEGFYLPIHENWPNAIDPAYNGGYWADQSLTARYRDDLVSVSRQFAEHCNQRGWNATMFQFFLNGKNDFKRNGWSRGSSPWVLDEPSSFQDFWALRYFGEAWGEGVSGVKGRAKMMFRADISRPQWQRDSLDGLLDYNVTSSAFRSYRRILLDRKRAEGQFLIEYGSSNAVDQSNLQPVGWSIDAWSLGADGVLPWQTVGNGDSWKQANTLSLFYPSRDGKEPGPIPSVRLKAFRRGQQDVEYLTMLAKAMGQPRWAVGERVREELRLSGTRKGTGFVGGEDAGVITYDRLTPEALASLRQRVGAFLSERRPPAARQEVELWKPRGQR